MVAKLTTDLHLVSWLRINSAICTLPHTPSQRLQSQQADDMELDVQKCITQDGLSSVFQCVNLSKPTSQVMHQQFNIQQLYVLPTLYLCVLYLSENKQRLVPLTA